MDRHKLLINRLGEDDYEQGKGGEEGEDGLC